MLVCCRIRAPRRDDAQASRVGARWRHVSPIAPVRPGVGRRRPRRRRLTRSPRRPFETARHGWLEFLIKVGGSSRFGAIVETLAPATPCDVDGPARRFHAASICRWQRDPVHRRRHRHRADALDDSRGARKRGTPDSHLAALFQREPTRSSPTCASCSPGAPRGCFSRLTLTLTGDAQDWTHARGRTGPGPPLRISSRRHPTAFICGPPAMVARTARGARVALGLPRDRVQSPGSRKREAGSW